MSRRSAKVSRRSDAAVGIDMLGALLERDRRRLVAPLLTDRVVYDVDAEDVPPEQCDVCLALRARGSEAALLLLEDIGGRLAPDAILVIAAHGETGPLHGRLRARFHRVLRFGQRPVAGSILSEDRFAATRITPLADASAAARPVCEVFVCGDAAFPVLPGGLFESGPTLPAEVPPPPPAPPPRSGASEGEVVSRAMAVELVHRLMAREGEVIDAAMQLRAMQSAAHETGAAQAGGWLDVQRSVHAWPLRDDPGHRVERLSMFDHRPNDDVFAVARAGDAFISAWSLDSDDADFSGAVRALNAASRVLRLVGSDDAVGPDVSIIVPVFGQLAYTLNCLDALFAHHAASSVEIIVVDDRSPDATRRHLPDVDGIRFHQRERNGGFIESCNDGAALARGRFVVLLNNDTRVMPGWLDALVESFSLFPRAGLVGSKLLYPDGTLQECGGIVWRDGSAWNFGRNDDPNRPEYGHARQVDYVSGASIAIPTAIWRQLGGFDPRYAPAYYEDVDFCFRLRDAGYETWVQPMSTLVHYEGKTSGTDVRVGVKAYQTRNRGRFFLCHREALRRHSLAGVAPLLAREPRVSRRALVIEPTAPTLKEDAGSGYTVAILRFLIDLGYKPYFVPENMLFRPEHTTLLQRMGIECAYAPYEPTMEAYLKRHGPMFDVAVVFRALTLERTVELLRTYVPQAPIVYNNIDLHYLRMQRAAEVAADAAALEEAAAMKVRELAVTARADCVLSPSPFEIELLARELPDTSALALPLMSDVEGTTRDFDTRRDICFLGGYRHAPNVDAVRFFIDAVLPLIQSSEPSIRFIVAGANPSEEILALARDDVVVTGMIDDLRDLFDGVRVFVCPLRFGAGMKGKILTAMSYGVPVVTSTVGVEGIAAADGTHLLVADEPAEIAAACLRLYREPALWRRLSEAGLDLIERAYSRASGREVMRRALDIAFERHFSDHPPR